jgi:hypothetical protein
MAEDATSFVAECFWPGVAESDLEALEERVRRAAAAPSRPREAARYLGSILLRDDEVVLCQFEGTAAAVRELAERAEIPFERILETTRSSWQAADTD